MRDLLEGRPQPVAELRARTLDSMVFLNRGGRFAAVPLPAEAQLAPAFGIAVADFDGDGAEDLFLAQNFSGVDPETSRLDAGRGLLLRGDGKGGWTCVPGRRSGILIDGEQRGCAVADVDEDGRPDLAVGQTAGATRLFRNADAARGLRVTLSGPPGNGAAFGAKLRLGSPAGPVRELHCGAGFASQDSATQVLARHPGPQRLWIQWPGGKITEAEVPAEARSVTAEPAGGIHVEPGR
jgi:hypothetical protein